MKKIILIFLSVFLIGCVKYKSESTTQKSSSCLIVEKYNKPLCLNDTINPEISYIFIDSKKIHNKKSKFNELTIKLMIVVEVKNNLVTLSNPENSVEEIYFKEVPEIEDIFYVICRKEILKDSKLIKYPETFSESDDVIIEDSEILDDEEYLDP